MDGANNWRPTQGADPAAVAAAGGVDPNAAAPAGGGWRAQLQPEARSRIVNKIMETLKKHLPVSVPEGLSELQKIAVRFEEKIYTAATNQSDYLRRISLKMLSMESQTKSQPNPGNTQVIPNQNPAGPASGLPPQGSNPAQSAIPLMSQQQTRQPNTCTSVQGSSLPSLGQSLPGIGQISTLQNMSGMPQNTMNNGLAQGAPQDIYAAQQRQMSGRQQQQQQAQSQLIYHQPKMLMNQNLHHMQPHIQQQQSLLQSTQMQSSQQPMMQMSSGLQPGQSNISQTQPMAMQSTTQSGIQQNPLNSVQQTVQSLLQQPTQSVVRQQQHPQSSMHQQPSLQQAQPTQQPNVPLQQQQQHLMGQQSSLQQSQLIGQQNNAVEMQQQQRLPVKSNSILNMQQTQQILNQQSMPLHQSQQLGSQANMSSLQNQQQQNQQQQLLGPVSNVSNIQRMHMLQQSKAAVQQPQQQQHAQQPSMGLMQSQSQQNQLQQPQQHIMSQFQSQPSQLQQQLGMQQQPSMQQRLQTSAGMLLQQNNIDQQKQYMQAQRGLQEVSSSTSVDSTAQTGHPGAGDWQEEMYQTIKSLKEQHFAELSDLYNKISMKLQHIDNHMPAQKQSDQYDKMKGFKLLLERTLSFLQLNKSNMQPALRDKIPTYEKQIIVILNSQRRKPVQTPGQQLFQQSSGQAPSSNISQQHQSSQGLQQHDSHANQMPQAPSMSTGVQSSGGSGVQHVPAPQATNFGVPTTQQNVANAQQAGSNMETAQGNSFNSVQHGSLSGSLQQGNIGHMQGAMNAQQQSSSNMLSHNSMRTMQPNTNSMQSNPSTLQQLKQQQQQQQEHTMMQSQQMKRQIFQQLQQKQISIQHQPPIQQQAQKQQQSQMQVPQLHSGHDVNELKVRQVAAMKSGIYQQVGPRGNNYQHLKQSGAFPISSPQNLQASSPQVPHPHHSPQVDQHNLMPSLKTATPLHSANSPFVPSPSPPVAPSPIPVDSDKPLSNLSSLTNAGQTAHQQTSLAPQAQSIAVNTPGISASPLLEFTSADGSQVNVPTHVPTKSSAAERPLDRLLKALRTTQRQSLSAAVSDIGSAVSMIDRIAGSAPGNGSRAAVGEDLVAMTKCRLQARNFITHDGSGTSKKMKRDTSAMPLNVSSAGSVNDSFKQSYSVDTPDLQSTATSRVKWQKPEVNRALMEEIQEINQQLIDTELHVCEDDAESSAATSEGAEGTVIKCTFTAVAVSPSLKSMFASAQMSPILPLRLLVPGSYPKCSPVLLDKFPDEQRNSDDLSTKVKSKFGILLRGLAEPMSLREISRTWDACARKVIAGYAEQTGGGGFSSSHGCWESCGGA